MKISKEKSERRSMTLGQKLAVGLAALTLVGTVTAGAKGLSERKKIEREAQRIEELDRAYEKGVEEGRRVTFQFDEIADEYDEIKLENLGDPLQINYIEGIRDGQNEARDVQESILRAKYDENPTLFYDIAVRKALENIIKSKIADKRGIKNPNNVMIESYKGTITARNTATGETIYLDKEEEIEIKNFVTNWQKNENPTFEDYKVVVRMSDEYQKQVEDAEQKKGEEPIADLPPNDINDDRDI